MPHSFREGAEILLTLGAPGRGLVVAAHKQVAAHEEALGVGLRRVVVVVREGWSWGQQVGRQAGDCAWCASSSHTASAPS